MGVHVNATLHRVKSLLDFLIEYIPGIGSPLIAHRTDLNMALLPIANSFLEYHNNRRQTDIQRKTIKMHNSSWIQIENLNPIHETK